jgi:TonB family protein
VDVAGITPHQRFKQGFSTRFWISLMAATALHAGVFAFSPEFAVVAAVRPESVALDMVRELPELPPPLEIKPPRAPTFVGADVDPDLTIPPNVIRRDRPLDLAAPAPEADEDDARVFVAFDVRPRLINPREVEAALLRHYPAVLRDARIGGVVRVSFHIDETGSVRERRVARSSGYDAFDAAALRVADLMEFTPALSRDVRVPVWVELDVRFEVP